MGKKGLVFLLVLSCLTLGGAGLAWATNGYQLIGIGAEELSMGGAVTAAPMDAMTAVTNPAGMARIGKRADFSMEAFMPARSVDFDKNSGDRVSGGSPMYGIPSIGWTAPAFGSENVYFGGGMFVTSGLGVDYGQTLMMPGAGLDAFFGSGHTDVTFDGYSAIQFWKIAPTIAWNVTPAFSIGVSPNIDYQSITISETINGVPFFDPSDHSKIQQGTVKLDLGRPTNQMGFGGTIGALYDVNKYITLGGVYTSRQYFSPSEYRLGDGDIVAYNGATGKAGTYKMDLDFPQQLAFGVAVKPLEALLISVDAKWINWSATHDKVTLSGPDGSFQKMDGSFTDHTTLNFGWSDQWVYSIGAQYAVNDKLTLRAGYNYGKSPIGEEDVFNNMVFPAIVEHHATAGASYKLDKNWGLSMTYMKAFKNTIEGKGDVSSDMQAATAFGPDSKTKISLEEDSVSVQLSYLF